MHYIELLSLLDQDSKCVIMQIILSYGSGFAPMHNIELLSLLDQYHKCLNACSFIRIRLRSYVQYRVVILLRAR